MLTTRSGIRRESKMDPNIKLNSIFVVALIVLAALIVWTEGSCDGNALSRCTAPMSSVVTSTINVTEPVFTQACAGVANLSTCMTQQGCTDKDTQIATVWHGLQNGYNYLCTDGRQVVLSNPKCLRDNVTMQHIAACETAYYNNGGASKKETFCASTQSFLNCAKNQLTNASCSQNVSSSVVMYIYKILQPVASSINCTLDASATKLSAPPCKASSWTLLGAALISSSILLLNGA